jgi:hypothetical protein
MDPDLDLSIIKQKYKIVRKTFISILLFSVFFMTFLSLMNDAYVPPKRNMPKIREKIPFVCVLKVI